MAQGKSYLIMVDDLQHKFISPYLRVVQSWIYPTIGQKQKFELHLYWTYTDISFLLLLPK